MKDFVISTRSFFAFSQEIAKKHYIFIYSFLFIMNLSEQTGIIISVNHIISKKTQKPMILIEYSLKGNKQIQQKWIYEDDPNFETLKKSANDLFGSNVKLTLEII